MLLRLTPIVIWAARLALAYTRLSDTTLGELPPVNAADFDINNKQGLLAPILIPRVPGTAGSAAVRQHFADFFSKELPAWQITYQNSTSKTPISNGQEIPFVNMIFTRDPPWADGVGNAGRLVLVAHYDSKVDPDGFIGATDSAAPCAMIMHAARAIDQALTRKWEAMSAQQDSSLELEEVKGIQILFLDGEEAFLMWTHQDSTYGARSLAAEWESTMYPAMSAYRNPLESMELFVLLDLLGAANPHVPSYFKTTHWAYKNLARIENSMRTSGQLMSKSARPFLVDAQKDENSRWLAGMIEDDHVPFLERGVEVLHLIPSPFPAVWHTADDDGEHLDPATVLDWAALTTAFAAEWMDLDGYFSDSNEKAKRTALPDRSEFHAS